jgi:phage repressor protein C with HTH and peptisase S24 domain
MITQTEKIEPIGVRIRKQRRRLGFTLDELAGRTQISKPYLSLIETGRVPNPPSDEKLRRLEQTLGFHCGDLVTQAHLQRTPRDVRAVLGRLLSREKAANEAAGSPNEAPRTGASSNQTADDPNADGRGAKSGDAGFKKAAGADLGASVSNHSTPKAARPAEGFDLDSAYLSGALHDLVDGVSANAERVGAGIVPVINHVSAGYPKEFTDLGYPPRISDQYVGAPDVADKEAFAARVHGDSMTPKYRPGDIVIFSPALAARDGDDCFIRFADGQTTFKRVFFESEGPAKTAVIRLQPRNEKYRPIVAGADSISGMYRAVYRYEKIDDQ